MHSFSFLFKEMGIEMDQEYVTGDVFEVFLLPVFLLIIDSIHFIAC